MAYLWGWPLGNNSNRRAAFAKVPEPGRLGGVLPAAPTGYVGMLYDYIDSSERFVTCPNQDTVYGAGFMALDKQPVVVQVPDFGERFYTYQIVDHRTDSFASASNTAPSPACTCWLGRTGKAKYRPELLPFSVRQPISLPFSPAFFRTIRQKTKRPSRKCSLK